MEGMVMNLVEYKSNLEEPYHFETSDNFCDLQKIKIAYNKTYRKEKWSKVEINQLNNIVELEKLRYKLSKKIIDYEYYKNKMHKISEEFFNENGFDVFKDTKIHNDFYYELNSLY
jgi:hypothetical protein